jgi:hypothetical protein
MTQGQDEVVLELIKFVKEHHGLLFHIMANEDRSVQLSNLEEIQLVTSILSKVPTRWSFCLSSGKFKTVEVEPGYDSCRSFHAMF